MALFALGWPASSAAQVNDEPVVISVSSTGEWGNGPSSEPSISADGRFVAFRSEADNLVPGDTNGVADIFVHDRLNGQTGRLSLAWDGSQADGPSDWPQISADGRFVLFRSAASNLVPGGAPPAPQLYLHDRLSGQTERISNDLWGAPPAAILLPVGLGSDGRYSYFQSPKAGLAWQDPDPASDVFYYDRQTGTTLLGSYPVPAVEQARGAEDGRTIAFSSQQGTILQRYNRVLDSLAEVPLPAGSQVLAFDLSGSGRVLVYTLRTAPQSFELYHHDFQSGNTKLLANLPDPAAGSNIPARLELASDGSQVGLLFARDAQQAELWLIASNGENTWQLSEQAVPGRLDLSANGAWVVYGQRVAGQEQVVIQASRPAASAGLVLAGRVGDAVGHPLALVSVTASSGASTRSDQQGYFWLGSLPAGSYNLQFQKDGYTFQPAEISLELPADRTDLSIQAFPEEILAAARLDLGMPYSFERGCPDPFTGCGGPFNGFYAGYCSDLVLDAFRQGAEFDLQFALVQDHRANPWHVYRWRDARDAHDLWRYFSYSGQVLPADNPAQPGDIIFFDWDEDGNIDHVALVAKVDSRNRPEMLLDASGVIDSNPAGLAAELPWEAFHERTQRGQVRWSGAYEPISSQVPPGHWLQAAFSAAGGQLRLLGPAGQALSTTTPRLENGFFADLGWEQTASLRDPAPDQGRYYLQIYNPSSQPLPYQLLLQSLSDGLVVDRQEWAGSLPAGRQASLMLRLVEQSDGGLGFELLSRQLSNRSGFRTASP